MKQATIGATYEQNVLCSLVTDLVCPPPPPPPSTVACLMHRPVKALASSHSFQHWPLGLVPPRRFRITTGCFQSSLLY